MHFLILVTAMGLPVALSVAGENLEPRTEFAQASISSAGPRTATTFSGFPEADTVYFTMTVPSIPAALAAPR